MRSAFQVWTVQAERKAKLYVYGGPKTDTFKSHRAVWKAVSRLLEFYELVDN
jgi:hypothetical protein